ncbi:thioredoxin-like protein [Calocera cornea HHB12733]|uniref:Thioredoxin-like protein n=1 Tax=Calocera cornea HHB12733 TaxID=1353952 RepID=A0A165ED19_9BASI|nr:thioredoxin-like protein [Calocera cornea HHB12733]
MALNPDEDTEFNDALRKHGILPPKAAPERTPSPEPGPTFTEQLDNIDIDELDELADDANDSETERFMRQYQRQRMAEMRTDAGGARFGTIKPIGRDDYTRDITDASKVDDEGEGSGTGVVAFLYKDGVPASVRLRDQLTELARRHPHTKFVSIIGDKCIPNYPDRNIPTLLMYRKGEMTNQVVAWGVARERSMEGERS